MSSQSLAAVDVSLDEFMNANHIVDEMDCQTVKQAVELLVGRLAELGLVEKKTVAVKRVMERERLASTALGSGVAIPHARMDVGERPLIAMGRHVRGIDFDAPDGKPVNLVFLLLWQPERPGLFNQLFASLVARLSNDTFRESLVEARDAADMLRQLGTIHLDWVHKVETALDGRMLLTLSGLEVRMHDRGEDQAKLKAQIELLRQDLDASVLWRYDRLRKLHGTALVADKNGVCGGCFMQLSSGMASELLKHPTALFVCEKCGRFLMHDIGE